tara:strand:+ start:2253 stop:3389 length:1137 start_codon:yes stop_codon:yes gene_type:complete
MANPKEYAFYVEGNNICIVERDTAFDNDVNSKDYGPGVHRSQWKSPKSSVTDGIQIQYTHTPDYVVSANASTNINKFYINGWTVVDGYLTFLRSYIGHSNADWDNAPFDHTDGIAAGKHIVVRGSDTWNGLHKIKIVGNETNRHSGLLVTETKVDNRIDVPYVGSCGNPLSSSEIDIPEITDSTSPGEIHTDDDTGVWLSAIFNPGDYIFISTMLSNTSGFFKISATDTGVGSEEDAKIYLGTHYYVRGRTGDGGTPHSNLSTEGSTTNFNGFGGENLADGGSLGTAGRHGIYKAFHDFSYVLTDVDVLNDESDELPIPSYLEKGLVYYVKARLAEDAGEFDKKEYFMREYKKITEKYDGSLKAGAKMIATPGPYGLR